MKRKITLLFVIIGLCSILIMVGGVGHRNITIKETTKSKEVGDFILHMYIENADEGVKVYSSLQYIGEGTIKLKHQEPLISVVSGNQRHFFTGETKTKQLNHGNIYHPFSDGNEFEISKKTANELHFEARFKVDDEEIIIKHSERLQFE